MTKKSFNQEDSRPSDYHKEVEAAKRHDKTNADKLIMTLRSDMVPASSVSPSKKNIFQKLNIKLIGGILIGVIILSLIWYSLAGPGRPVLEQKLAGLVNLDPTSTQQVDPSPIPSTMTIPAPSIIPSSSPTVHPTHTPTMKIVATATSLSATSTPTSSTACRDVSTITLADVGKSFCVQGTVIEIIDKPNEFMLVFSYERNAFYWVSYDMVWSSAEVNTCYQIKGMIRQILNSPILVFDYSNKPEECP